MSLLIRHVVDKEAIGLLRVVRVVRLQRLQEIWVTGPDAQVTDLQIAMVVEVSDTPEPVTYQLRHRPAWLVNKARLCQHLNHPATSLTWYSEAWDWIEGRGGRSAGPVFTPDSLGDCFWGDLLRRQGFGPVVQ
jgi:hypothetical protein